MHRTWTLLASLSVAVSTVGAIACSSTSAPPGTASGPVSFKNDVMPIFQLSCTTSTVCHGQMNNVGEENLYLGDHKMNGDTTPTPQAMVDTVYHAIVGVKSLEDPKMDLVALGATDTSTSYLFHKVATDQNMFATDCAASTMPCTPTCNATTPCGASMPYLGPNFPTDEPMQFAVIQNWISQGAKNN